MGMVELLGIEFGEADGQRVEATMPAANEVMQPFGYVHGGATIALLESVASLGAQLSANLDVELPFGVDVHVRHRKGATGGTLHAVARLEDEEPTRGGRKQVWAVETRDDTGDVVSEGAIVTKTVSRAYLAERER